MASLVLLLLAGFRETITAWDRAVFHAINTGLRCAALDAVMPFVTDLGLGHVQAAALVVAACTAGALRGEFRGQQPFAAMIRAVAIRRRWIVPAMAALIITGIAVQFPKRVLRHRPSWFYATQKRAGLTPEFEVRTIRGRRPLRVNGFPSGHTATSTAIALVLSARVPRRRGYGTAIGAAWILTAAIGLSRVYMADHWPLDVVGGVLFGVLGGTLVLCVFREREQ